jgi:hypothetical protein
MRRTLILPFLLAFVFFVPNQSEAQQYKLRQSTSISGMNMETTIYVKGMRKRTESAGIMGMPPQPILIEQCDLQRTIKLNDKKKLYFIEPFAKEGDVIDEDAKPAVAVKTKTVSPSPADKGGVIHMWYNITDTGERKKMNGFVARHIWTTQKIKPGPNTCSMKDSMIMKTDGWYIDLPQFNCPIRFNSSVLMPRDQKKPECQDKFVTHRSGKGKLGFPLIEKRTIIMGSGQTNEFTTNLETVELSTLKLDSMLFEIPPGYTQTMNEQDLQDKMDMNAIINQYKNMGENSGSSPIVTEQKKEGVIRIGVYEPKSDGQVQGPSLQQHLAGVLTGGNIEAIAVTTEEDARTLNCNYTLTTAITKMKSGSKVGGLLKAIKNTDPNAASSFTIDATLTLLPLTGGASPSPQNVSGKYEGKPDDAARKAMDDGAKMVLKSIK